MSSFLNKSAFLLFSTTILLVLALGCGGPRRLTLDFKPSGGSPLNQGIVQLLVSDARPGGQLVGPEAAAKILAQESQDNLVDMTTIFANGAKVSQSNLTATQIVYQATKHKLQTLGITANPNTTGAKARVTILISEFIIDIENDDFVGRVSLQATIDRPGIPEIYRSAARASGSKRKLISGLRAGEALSDALNECLNNLDFSTINNFPNPAPNMAPSPPPQLY
ncbi:MAG: hypothetical protein LBV23_05150 [Deltaproteobacteria bacterium]|jgi:hypothetical protein|nr:hypothetical protein [Deltaproteobacteria bacterium]